KCRERFANPMQAAFDRAQRHVHVVGDFRQRAILDQRLAGDPFVDGAGGTDGGEGTTDLVAIGDLVGGIVLAAGTLAEQFERDRRLAMLARPGRGLATTDPPNPAAGLTGSLVMTRPAPDGEKSLLHD